MDCKKLTADDLTSVMNLDSARTIWGEMMEDSEISEALKKAGC